MGVPLPELERLAPKVTEGVTVRLLVPETVCDAEILLDLEQRKPTHDREALADCDSTPVILVIDAVGERVTDMDTEGVLDINRPKLRDMEGELLAIRVIVRLFEPDSDTDGDCAAVPISKRPQSKALSNIFHYRLFLF